MHQKGRLVNFPIFKTAESILVFCWGHRKYVALYASVPLILVACLNLLVWSSGTDLQNIKNPVIPVINVINSVLFLPFTVAWYRLIILGAESIKGRKLYSFTQVEVRMLGWHILITLISVVFGSIGALVIVAITNVLPLESLAVSTISLFCIGCWLLLMISITCRLSLLLPMTAAGRPAIIAEAWARTKGIGERMAGVFVLCIFFALSTIVVLDIISSGINSIFTNLLGEQIEVLDKVLKICISSVGSLIVLLLPTTLFGFTYNHISQNLQPNSQTIELGGQVLDNDLDGNHAKNFQSIGKAVEGIQEKIVGANIQNLIQVRSFFDGLFKNKETGSTEYTKVNINGVQALWVKPLEAKTNNHQVILMFHGGTFNVGSIVTHKAMAEEISRDTSIPVLLLDYALAPEKPYPNSLDECVIAYKWLLSRNIKPGHIALIGDSAGGGLVVSTALKIKEYALDQPAALIAISPWVNLACDGETIVSKVKEDPFNKQSYMIDAARMYLNGHNPKDPFVSPIFADLRGLPPILIQVGSAEILLDDSRKLAARARADDVDVNIEEWGGMFTGWHLFFHSMLDGKKALNSISAFIKMHTN